jgi:hypothetical protein
VTEQEHVEHRAFEGVSDLISESKAPAAWKDAFVLNVSGYTCIVPCQAASLMELTSGTWVMKTPFGAVKPRGKDSLLDSIMAGAREFSVDPTDLAAELLRR